MLITYSRGRNIHVMFTGLLQDVIMTITSVRVLVSGWSMYPELFSGDRVLFERLSYRKLLPKRGDVVLTRGDNVPLIKRIVGLPEDTIRSYGGLLSVNDTDMYGLASKHMEYDQEWILGKDEYFLVGDYLERSLDSRSFGPIHYGDIRAKAWLVFWPLNRWRKFDS